MQILAATMVTAGLLILAVAQLPVLSSASGRTNAGQLRLLRPSTGEYTVHVAILTWLHASAKYAASGIPRQAQSD